jgi:hypothetical protein
MLNNQKLNNCYLLAFSNLLAAFGGGLILGKGIACISAEYLKSGSILAFFTGTVLGLVFLQSIPASLSKSLTRFFSFFSGSLSIILLLVFNEYSHNQVMTGYTAYIFFALLSIRFSFWFYSRVRRAAEAAKIQHRIAWVELGYYIGIISGLIIWRIINIPISLSAALILDAIFQFVAGIIDLSTSRKIIPIPKNQTIDVPLREHSTQINWASRLMITLTTLTIGTQAIIFSLAHDVSVNVGTYILAVFYVGVALAAYAFRIFLIKLDWSNFTGTPLLQFNNRNIKLSHCIILLSIIISGCIFIAKEFDWIIKCYPFNSEALLLIIFLLLISLSSFIYELIALSVIDRINIDCPQDPDTIIIRSYGLMGIGSAIALWTLGLFSNNYYGLFTLLFLCMIIGTISILQKYNLIQIN